MTQLFATDTEMEIHALDKSLSDVQIHEPMLRSDQQPKRTSRSGLLWIGWIVTVILSVAAGRYLWVGNPQADHKIQLQEASISNEFVELISVTSSPVQLRQIQRTVSAVGSLYGYEELTISSKIDGRVLRIHHDLAGIVRPGDLLLELDPTDASLSINQAEKGLLAELAKWGFRQVPTEKEDLSQLPSVVSAKHRFDLAVSRLARLSQLVSSKSISAEEMEQVGSETQVLESDWKNQLLLAQAAAATARLRSAELEIAKQRLRDGEIRVPSPTQAFHSDQNYYSISERLVTEGTMLRPGTELFRLILGRALKLRLSVPESLASKIEVGQDVHVLAASAAETQTGKVARISPVIDRDTRTFQVEVDVPNEQGLCKPGGFAKAEILIGGQEDAITVPDSAIYSLAGIHKIFVLQNGVAQEMHVTLGEPAGDWVEIVSPKLAPDAVLVTSGQRLLSDGIRVNDRTAALDESVGPPSAQSSRKFTDAERSEANVSSKAQAKGDGSVGAKS